MGIINFQEASQRIQQRATRPAPSPQMCMTTVIPLWLTNRCTDNHRPRGIDSYRDMIERFTKFAGDIPVGQITTELIEEYKRTMMQRLAAKTTCTRLTPVRSFCAWLLLRGYIDHNPALAVAYPKVEPPDPDPLTREQIKALFAALDDPSGHRPTWKRTRRAICLMLYAGLRLGEVAALEWRDVDLDRLTITVRRNGAKGGKPRVVPICAELLTELDAAVSRPPNGAVVDQGDTPQGSGKPLKLKSLAHVFERWLTRRGIHIHSHQLRKTFATELYIRGEDIATIQRLLGHTDPKTTMRYIGVSAQKDHEAVNTLTIRQEAENVDSREEE